MLQHGIVAVYAYAVRLSGRCSAHKGDIAHHQRFLGRITAPIAQRVIPDVRICHACHFVAAFLICLTGFATEQNHKVIHRAAAFMGVAVQRNEIVGTQRIHLASNSFQSHNLLLPGFVGIHFGSVAVGGCAFHRAVWRVFVHYATLNQVAGDNAVACAAHYHLCPVGFKLFLQLEGFPQIGFRLKEAQRVHILVVDGRRRTVAGGPSAVSGVHINHFAFKAFRCRRQRHQRPGCKYS